MAKTLDELVQRAAGIMNEIGAGQPVSAEDAALIKGYAPDLFAQLRESEIIVIGDEEAIDEAVFTPLARMLANEAGPELGIARDQAIFDNAELQIRRVNSTKVYFQPLKVQYF